MMPGFYRPSPVPSFTDHTLYQPIRDCSLCTLRSGCDGPVPGVGKPGSLVMLVGEAPGEHEDKWGIPFTGNTWLELENLLGLAGLSRDTVYITNTVKCRPRPPIDPDLSHAHPCLSTWLDQEVAMVRPKVVVLMGQLAIRSVLGEHLTVSEVHGYAQWYKPWKAWVLPVYHPSAGIHQTHYLNALREDFTELGRVKRGVIKEPPVDSHPTTQYTWGKGMESTLSLAVDIETLPDNSVWCVNYTYGPGWAVVVRQDRLDTLKYALSKATSAIFHNGLYDIPRLYRGGVPVDCPIDDTIVMARLLQLDELGLKSLSVRHLGMDMSHYQDVIGPAQERMALEYFRIAADFAPDRPRQLAVPEWDPKVKDIVVKTHKPQSLRKKILATLKKADTGAPVDLTARWKKYEEDSPAEVEELAGLIGPFPAASLADVPQEQALQYAARDADATFRLYRHLKPLIEAEGLQQAYDIDMGALPMVAQMSANGVLIDQGWLEDVRAQFEQTLAEAEVQCWGIAGKVFNPNSDNQVRPILFTQFKVPIRGYTDTKLPSTQDDYLLPFKGRFPIIGAIIKYRQMTKYLSTYVNPYLALARESGDGRVHCDHGQTVTGRYAARDPNLMAIPKHTKESKLIRNGIVAPPGKTFLAWDLSQIEMRVLAHVCQDREMLRIFRAGEDTHTATAMQVFGKTKEEVEADEEQYRQPMKQTGFGIVYGIGAPGLWNSLEQRVPGKFTVDQCQAFIDLYLGARPGVKQYMSDTIAEARRTGAVRDMFGRRRWMWEVKSQRRDARSGGEREAINFPIQTGALNVMKTAMAKLWKQYGRSIEWALQIHDEVIAAVDLEVADEVQREVRSVIESAVELTVPLLASAKRGARLGEIG